jgi:hypothetical protein
MHGWRHLGLLQPGDHIAAARRLPALGRCRWLRHEIIVTADLLAEGNFYHPTTLYFCTTSPLYRDEFVRCVERFPNTRATVARHRNAYSIHVRRRDPARPAGVTEWVRRHGLLGVGAREKRLPEEVFELRDTDLALLLARLWEGDGHLSSARYASYGTVSRQLAEQVQHLLLRLGVISRVYERTRLYRDRLATFFTVTVTGKENLARFCRVVTHRFLDPARRRAARALTCGRDGRMSRDVIPRLGRHFRSGELLRLARSDIYWDRVTGIEPLGMRETYDLHIEGDHNFLANDLVVHNSHAASFALVAFASAYLKRHYHAEFTCALLNAQPMGFYAPSTIVEDARRHGVEVRPIDVLRSDWDCTLEKRDDSPWGFTLRMGLRYVKGLGEEDGRRVMAVRGVAPFESLGDFARRTGLDAGALVTLAKAGAFEGLGVDRREALWQVRALARRSGMTLPVEVIETTPPFDGLTALEQIAWDYDAASHSVRGHPLDPLRDQLTTLGLPDAQAVMGMRDGDTVRYAGLVICRQTPGTASGVTFMTLEDETGFVNLVVWPKIFERYAGLAKSAPLLGVTGRLQRQQGVVHIVAQKLWQPTLNTRLPAVPSRDFR